MMPPDASDTVLEDPIRGAFSAHAGMNRPVAPIYDWFTEGFDTPVLQNAKALLDQLA